MKRFLIVSSTIDKNKFSGSICTINIIHALQKIGEVDVLTEKDTLPNFNIQESQLILAPWSVLRNITSHPFIRKVFLKLNINVIALLRSRAFLNTFKSLNLNSYDYIIALGAGFNFSPHLALGAVKTTAKKWCYMHDPYPSKVVLNFKQGDQISHYEKAEINRLKKALDQMDMIWFPSQALAKRMRTFYHFPAQKAFTFPHPIPYGEEIDQDKLDTLLQSFNLKQNQFFLHTGTLSKKRKVFHLVEGFKRAKQLGKVNEEIKLVFLGRVQYDINHLISDDVIFINDRWPYMDARLLSAAAKSLLIIEHLAAESYYLPGKVPEYIAMKKPIMHFGPKKSETNSIVKNIDGFSAPLNDIESIMHVFSLGGQDLTKQHHVMQHFDINKLYQKFKESAPLLS